ncbi:MAG: MnhB domain-containing protein [Candidatus Nezhaarchaeota archaeon]|nr:MnhB domain-containing protein [Candidatus Nezhaarchaeota archaeon]
MSLKDAVLGVAMAVFLLMVSVVVVLGGTGWTPSTEIRPLAKFYLENCFNVFNRTWWAASPEAVTSMLWDYRGIDTYYETSVFFLAVIGGVTIFRVTEAKLHRKMDDVGLSLIVKTTTRMVFPLVVIVSASVALHGNLTPGGGFQAGVILAVGPLLLIAAFSRSFLEENLKLSKDRCLIIRSVGLIAIALLVALPLMAGSLSLMQNQAKPWSQALQLPEAVGPIWTSGTLLFFNVAEFLAVGAGFTLLFLLLSAPEEELKRAIGL